MKTLKSIKLLFCFVVMLTIFLASACNHDNDKDKNKVPEQLGTMEITGLNVESENLNPATLVDGKKKITVNNAEPKLEVRFKKKYDELKGEVKIAGHKTDIVFTSASVSYTFATLTKEVEVDVEVLFTAKNMKAITLKFKLFYKELEPLNVTKITVAGTEFAPPFDATLKGQNIEVKKNDVTIVVETADGTEGLTGNVNNSSFTRDPARQNIASVRLTNLAEGENDITLKASAKDKKEVTYTFKITWTRLPPIGIKKIEIDDKAFVKGSTLETLNGLEVEITKKGAINIKVELEKDYEEKKVQIKSAGEGVSTKPANWAGKVATLSCKEEWKNVDIIIKAKDKEDATYSVKIERVKGEIEVFQILLNDDEKYGHLGKDLSLLLNNANTTEKVIVKKAKAKVRVTLGNGESVDKGEVIQEGASPITTQLKFTGTVAEVELTLKEGDNNCKLHLEKNTKKGTKIVADYKFNLHYIKQDIAFKYIKMKLDEDDKYKEDSELQSIISQFIQGSDDIYAYKKDYSLWNKKMRIICLKNNATDVAEYAVSTTKTKPTNWTAFTKTGVVQEFSVDLTEATSYVYFRIKNATGTEERIYLAELSPKLTETGLVDGKVDIKYMNDADEGLDAQCLFTKKVKLIVKPKDPRIKGIKATSHSDTAFTKVVKGQYPRDKFVDWWEATFAVAEPKTFNIICEVTESNDAKTPNCNVEVKITEVIKEFEIGYDSTFTNKVSAVEAGNKFTFTLENGKITDKKLYVRMYFAEYYTVVATQGVTFVNAKDVGGNDITKVVDGTNYILKTVTIENFENAKNFEMTIGYDGLSDTMKKMVEITAN